MRIKEELKNRIMGGKKRNLSGPTLLSNGGHDCMCSA